MQIAIEVTPRTLAGSYIANCTKDHYVFGGSCNGGKAVCHSSSVILIPIHLTPNLFAQYSEIEIASALF